MSESKARKDESQKGKKSSKKSTGGLKPGKVRCEGCKKKCSGDILKTEDKYFHVKCFVCSACREPLNQSGFFLEAGSVYCPRDYHARFGVRCAVCNQFIEGDVTNFLEKSFHPNCFKCDRCRRVIPAGSVTRTEKENLCQKCAESLKSPTDGPSVTQDSLVVPHDGLDLTDSMSSPAVCAACDQCISSGQVLLALDTQWHTWCFKCTVCHCVLHGEYMEKDGLPYCVRDYDLQFGIKCHECNKYISGRVLQAGNFHFHPNCARCSRCEAPFLDGQEMYMHGNEIWHPSCNEIKSNDTMRSVTAHVHRSSPQLPKYSVDFGRHLLYMYLLPEPNMGYLKQPVSPYPPRTPQFHTPQGNQVKIRRSRISMLKTGMQKLAEALEESSPRPRSPAMNNEEPIELSHYPGGHAPAPGELAPIERDDFPAPPYPYAVEEFKRRLSSNERLDEEEAMDSQNESRILKAEHELNRIKDESSLARVFVQELENDLKKSKVPLHVDPRSSSRTPSANRMPHLKCRYDSPINASPSRYLNRPRPWQRWDKNKALTATIPYAQIPKAGYGLAPKAATIPHSNVGALFDFHSRDMNATFSSDMSDRSYMMTSTSGSYDRYQPAYGSGVLRSSLPDMSKPPKIYHYDEIVTTNKKLPEDVDRCHLERHLSRNEFESIFHMTPIEFYKLPEWKRINLKRRAKLF
uniref:Actin-binding LIM protein 1 n=1 Tax=Trichuris muris TaxID=70415 RepID=A0A5S6QN20_TRIMR